jgi:CDP-paratose 2-epimerase
MERAMQNGSLNGSSSKGRLQYLHGGDDHNRGSNDERPVLITGGAGFVGTNLAHRLLCAGRNVLVYDDLSRPGVERNWQWLQATHGDKFNSKTPTCATRKS